MKGATLYRRSVVSAAQLRAGVIEHQICRIDHHRCGVCGAMTCYLVDHNFLLFFDASCDCSSSEPESREWESAERWVNMQSDPEIQKLIAGKFGVRL